MPASGSSSRRSPATSPATSNAPGSPAPLPAAYRSGGGVPYAHYGQALRDGIAPANRPIFLHELASAWLPAVSDVDQRLRSAPSPRVLDLGCGLGASSVALARAYPRATVLGVDLDETSVAQARAAAAEAGVADRVSFVVGDAALGALEAPFDLVTIFEALHDMGDPVGALRSARGGWPTAAASLSPTSAWPTPSPLPVTTLARWAAAAGLTGFEVLAVDNPFWRFYRLRG